MCVCLFVLEYMCMWVGECYVIAYMHALTVRKPITDTVNGADNNNNNSII